MIANVVYGLSVFSDYANISYSNENILEIVSEFEKNKLKLLPSIFHEVRPNGMVEERMQFFSEDKAIVIFIYSDRILLQSISSSKSGFKQREIEVLQKDLFKYITLILRVLSKRTSNPNRLAWVTSYINFDLSDEKKSLFKDKFLNKVSFFTKNPLDDLLVRYAAQRDLNVLGDVEKTNIVLTIASVLAGLGPKLDVDGYRIDYDINTWHGDKRSRFDSEKIKAFIEQAVVIQKQLDEEVIS